MRRKNYSRGYYGGHSDNSRYGHNSGRSRYNNANNYYTDDDSQQNYRQRGGGGSGSWADHDNRFDGHRYNRGLMNDYDSPYHRSGWNNERENNQGYDNYSRNYRNRQENDDRNFFQRAGDRIRDTWNNWTGDDNRDERYHHGRNSNYGRYDQEDLNEDRREGNYRNYRGGEGFSSRNYNGNYPSHSSERNYGGRAGWQYGSENERFERNRRNYGGRANNSYHNDYRYQRADSGRYGSSPYSHRWETEEDGEHYFNDQRNDEYDNRRRRLQEPEYTY